MSDRNLPDVSPSPVSQPGSMADYVEFLKAGVLKDAVVHHTTLPARPRRLAPPLRRFPSPRWPTFSRPPGLRPLYSHQAEGIGKALDGENVVVATPTASGKTLVYNVPVITTLLENPEAHALYIFPLKALVQDQYDELHTLLQRLGRGLGVAVYDGDTPAHRRRQIRGAPPNVLITTPDMLHAGLLAFHEAWAGFFARLRYVVIDELHTYSGVFGTHVLHLLRRLNRLCAAYGSRPAYITSSATIGNPEHLASHPGEPAVSHRFRQWRSGRGAARGVRQSARKPAGPGRPPAADERDERATHDRLHAGTGNHRAHLPLGDTAASRTPRGHLLVPRRLPARGAAPDRSRPAFGRVAWRRVYLGPGTGHRHRKPGRVHSRRLPRLHRQYLAARRAGGARRTRGTDHPHRRPGRPRSVPHQIPRTLPRAQRRGCGGGPGQRLHPQGPPGVRRPRDAVEPRRARVCNPRLADGGRRVGARRRAPAERRRRHLARRPQAAAPPGQSAQHRRIVDPVRPQHRGAHRHSERRAGIPRVPRRRRLPASRPPVPHHRTRPEPRGTSTPMRSRCRITPAPKRRRKRKSWTPCARARCRDFCPNWDASRCAPRWWATRRFACATAPWSASTHWNRRSSTWRPSASGWNWSRNTNKT